MAIMHSIILGHWWRFNQFANLILYQFTTRIWATMTVTVMRSKRVRQTLFLNRMTKLRSGTWAVILSEVPTATPSPVVTGTPPNWFIPSEPYVGPIRSGRLTYNQIGGMFPNSCLVYASAAWDIGEMLDACEIVFGVDKTTPNSALLPVTRLRELAEQSLNPRQPVNYSGNLFSDAIPDGGQPATAINVFYHSYTQSAWQYDPISGTYLRWTDLADGTEL
jgi:hypothetical protein